MYIYPLLKAAIAALGQANMFDMGPLEIRTDSMYTINGMRYRRSLTGHPYLGC